MSKLKFTFILVSTLLGSLKLLAQNSESMTGCKNLLISQQVAELKEEFKEQGFEVINDAMFELNSRTNFPIIYKLQKSEFYQIIFVASDDASKMKLELIDPDENILLSKELRPIQHTTNVISFNFSPISSDSYTFLLSQIIKKGSCVSFTIMKLKSEAELEESPNN
jgi:hypothetical protein